VTASLGTLHGDRRRRDTAALSALADAVISGEFLLVAALLSPQATLYSDGGGAVNASIRPEHGAEKIARFLVGIAAQPGVVLVPSVINGSAGLVFHEGATVTTSVALRVGLDGIGAMYFVRNPVRLRRLQPETIQLLVFDRATGLGLRSRHPEAAQVVNEVGGVPIPEVLRAMRLRRGNVGLRPVGAATFFVS